MKVNNVPTAETAAGGEALPPPTWQVIVDSIKPPEHSVAKALLDKYGEVAWKDVLAVTTRAADATQAT